MQVNAEDCAHEGSLSVENVLWANTVLASGTAVGLVLRPFLIPGKTFYKYKFQVYTGRETRSVMNTTLPESKVGLLDLEVSFICVTFYAIF